MLSDEWLELENELEVVVKVGIGRGEALETNARVAETHVGPRAETNHLRAQQMRSAREFVAQESSKNARKWGVE